MIDRAHRNDVNMASLIFKYVLCFMYMYLRMLCEKDGEAHSPPWNMLYNVYNLSEIGIE